MLIKILAHHNNEGQPYFEWDLWDGPDGIDHVHGYATDLITAFSKIIEWREKIAQDYANEVLQDLENARQFLKNTNETD